MEWDSWCILSGTEVGKIGDPEKPGIIEDPLARNGPDQSGLTHKLSHLILFQTLSDCGGAKCHFHYHPPLSPPFPPSLPPLSIPPFPFSDSQNHCFPPSLPRLPPETDSDTVAMGYPIQSNETLFLLLWNGRTARNISCFSFSSLLSFNLIYYPSFLF